ncbi:hypothetical protein OC844_007871 [Tilletia horrida]|nr:hypothetical protein OC844_007871 [Tilletia horrida]
MQEQRFCRLLLQQKLYRRSGPPIQTDGASSTPMPSILPAHLLDTALVARLHVLDAEIYAQAKSINSHTDAEHPSLSRRLAEFDVLCALAISRGFSRLRHLHKFPGKSVEIIKQMRKHSANVSRASQLGLLTYAQAIDDACLRPLLQGALQLHQQHLKDVLRQLSSSSPSLGPRQAAPALLIPPIGPPTASGAYAPAPQAAHERFPVMHDRLQAALRQVEQHYVKLEYTRDLFHYDYAPFTAVLSAMQQLDYSCNALLALLPVSRLDNVSDTISPLVAETLHKMGTARTSTTSSPSPLNMTSNDEPFFRVYKGGLVHDALTRGFAAAEAASKNLSSR